MNFTELAEQTMREHQMKKLKLSKRKIKEVYIYTVKTMITELLSDPEHARIRISGFGNLYLTQRTGMSCSRVIARDENNKGIYDTTKVPYTTWQLIFTPSKMLKDVLNDRRPLDELRISGTLVFRKKGRPKKLHKRPYVRKKPETINKNLLPDDED